MALSKHISTLLVLFLCIQTAFSVSPLKTICFNSKNYTSKSSYEKTLMLLMGQLYFMTPRTGFGQASLGQYPDKAYGISLCRGDVSMKDCATCVIEASSEIVKYCPRDKGAIIWYDNCYLKYSDDDFLHKIDVQNKFYLLNVQNASTNSEEFNHKIQWLLSKLSEDATVTNMMYASGDVEVAGYDKVYGMVQCSRDISKVDCKKCLDDAIGELPTCCGGKVGGRVVGGSCNIRYEIYPFLNY